ncbi:hypothetical protein Salat_2695600 [Sesamum alatum]|uniref:Uncharacterized protein n=1 Tax=Sesamum alatum TaxID=300844 RepID=A0AAE1XPY2_9LAMI|nr:hypothetical protein Salat_2695600 [Sesamum alatum]
MEMSLPLARTIHIIRGLRMEILTRTVEDVQDDSIHSVPNKSTPIRTICAFEVGANTIAEDNVPLDDVNLDMEVADDVEREYEKSLLNVIAIHGSTCVQADDDDFEEAKVKGRHRHGISIARPDRVLKQSHVEVHSTSL